MSETFDDVDQERQQRLKEIVRELHEGSDVAGVRRRFADLIRDVSPEEIAAMEQALIDEGVPVEQVQKVCDVHVEVFQQALQKQRRARVLPGHPVHTYREENKAVRKILRGVRRAARAASRGRRSHDFEQQLGRLNEIETHFRRKENQLFPVLERVGFAGPSKVMWGKHDEIRASLRDLEQVRVSGDLQRLFPLVKRICRAIRRMLFMEERILFPTAMRKLSDQQWAEIRRGEAAIGYAWIRPGNLWDPSVIAAAAPAAAPPPAVGSAAAAPPVDAAAADAAVPASAVELDVGRLTPEQVNLLLRGLPLDVTFVDEQDRVRYYSQGRERIFPRSPAIIGREVRNCHPPKSVHVVEQILESFRKKERDTAEFWLTVDGRFIHIRYFAVYDADGTYRGVIEVSQDVTDIRALEGEKRLLD